MKLQSLVLGVLCWMSAGCEPVPAAKAENPPVRSKNQNPPLEDAWDVGRYALGGGTFEATDGTEEKTLLRLDTMTGKAWRLTLMPRFASKPDADGNYRAITTEDGRTLWEYKWQSIEDP